MRWSVALEELFVYFLGIPALGYTAGALWVRYTMKRIAERRLGFLRDEGANSRLFVYLALFATPIVFGVVVFVQAIQPMRETPTSVAVLRTLGWTFALAAVLTVLSQAWIVVRWKAASFGDMFARILVLAAIPETVILWVLNISILALGVLNRDSTSPPISQGTADALTRSLEIMMIATLAAPLSALLSNRQPVLNLTTFRKVLLWAVLGDVLAVLCLILAIGQLPRS